MIKRLAHVCMHTEDLDATRAFYCDTLGMKKAFDFIRNGEPHGYYLVCGPDNYIEVFKGKKAEGQGAIKHLCLEVDDIESVRKALLAGGYEATETKTGGDGSLQCWSTGPGGERVEFHQYTAASSQKTGKTVVVTW